MTSWDELRRIPLIEDLPDDAPREMAGRGLEKFVPAGDVRMEAGA